MSQCNARYNFTCESKKMCILLSQKCDHIVHCHDGSDEVKCPVNPVVGPIFYKLRNSKYYIVLDLVYKSARLVSYIVLKHHILLILFRCIASPFWITSIARIPADCNIHACYTLKWRKYQSLVILTKYFFYVLLSQKMCLFFHVLILIINCDDFCDIIILNTRGLKVKSLTQTFN